MGFTGGSVGKKSSAMEEMWVQSLGWKDPLEKGMATRSSTLAWRIPMDKGAWWAAVHGVSEKDTTEWLHTHTNTHTHTQAYQQFHQIHINTGYHHTFFILANLISKVFYLVLIWIYFTNCCCCLVLKLCLILLRPRGL